MLDSRATEFFRNAIAVQVHEFDQDLQRRLAEVRGRAIQHGAYGGSGQTVGELNELRAELRRRAGFMFVELQRALALYPPTMDGLLSALVTFFSAELKDQSQRLKMYRGHPAPHTRAAGNHAAGIIESGLDQEYAHLTKKYAEVELRAYVDAALQRSERMPPPAATTNIFNAPINVVQTGPNATATVSITVSEDDRSALLAALDLVGTTFRESQQLARDQQRELLELISQASQALRTEKPNGKLLRGLFIVVCETLQTLSAAEPALAALRAAALPLGIVL